MKAIVQRVSSAQVAVKGKTVGYCASGLLLLVGAHKDDGDPDAVKLADRVLGLRIFGDADGKMNLALSDFAGSSEPNVLAISNFTVYGETSKNRRPSFTSAAPYAEGERLFGRFVDEMRRLGLRVETGVFGAHMDVSLVNDGPVTVILETR